MALYQYVKAPPKPIQPKPKFKVPPTLARIMGPAMITIGSLLLANVAWPIISYQFFVSPQIQRTEFISPLSPEQTDQMLANAPPPTKPSQPQTPQVLGADLDYTDPGIWFPEAQYQPAAGQKETYYIDIPAINIESAEVVYGGDNLDNHLIQYTGTAMPGELGSPVIFGHSILRQFYNPSINNPNRYISIFSKIMTLKNDDKIYITYDGIKYTYAVKDKVEVKPEDIFILEQRYNNRELKLITCVPEGTYLRRGVVIAQLIEVE